MAPSGELRGKGRCGVFAGKTVWSTPERLRDEVLTTRRYTNTFTFTFTFNSALYGQPRHHPKPLPEKKQERPRAEVTTGTNERLKSWVGYDRIRRGDHLALDRIEMQTYAMATFDDVTDILCIKETVCV